MRTTFAILTLLIWIINYIIYNRAAIKKVIRPTLGFWLTISILDWLVLIALIAAGVRGLNLTQIVVWTLGASTTTVITIFLNQNIKISKIEVACLVVSILGVIGWITFKNPRLALMSQGLSIVIGSLPFWINSIKGNERWQVLVYSVVGTATSLGTVSTWDISMWPTFFIPVLGFSINTVSLILSYIGGKLHQAPP